MQQAAESSSLIGVALEERYQILREIGRGGMGIVYEAEHVDLGKRVAIKVMLDKYANDDEAIARFKREALAASRIGNPHIIDVAHIGATPDGRPFVAMELLDGEPLSNILTVTGPMQPWRAIHIMRQVLRAVGAAHAKGIIHRDLKPDNIFIVNRDDEHDFVKLLDFGISKIIDTAEQMAATKLTTTGMVMGTPLYMAPEQATGAPAERGVDIYACGVILFEMLSGRPPFNETNYNLLIAKLLTASPPLLSDLRKGLPSSLVVAVHRALEKDPEHRFPTAEAFAQALPSDRAISEPNLEVMDTLPPGSPGASHHATPPATVQPARSSVPRWVLGSVLALAGIGAITAAVLLGKGDKPAAAVATTPAPLPVPAPPAPAPPAPVPETGKLEIETIPSGASVRVDSRDVGSTPIEVTLPHGRHKLHVELASFTAIDADQDVHTSERTTTVITLVRAPRSAATVARPKPNKIVTTTRPLTAGSATSAPLDPYGAPNDVAPDKSATPDKPKPDKPKPQNGTQSMPNPY
ncbi:MAG: serine/threonine-protein kinase [Deltaproteobacteria bacterium]